jgi:hypothetical protein
MEIDATHRGYEEWRFSAAPPYRVLQSASTKVREYLHEFVADGDAGELHGGDGIGRLRNLCVRAHESSDSDTCGREQIESERREVRLTHVRQALQQTVVGTHCVASAGPNSVTKPPTITPVIWSQPKTSSSPMPSGFATLRSQSRPRRRARSRLPEVVH